LARIRRTGIGEAILGDVVDEVKKLGLMSQLQPVTEYVLAPRKEASLDGVLGANNPAITSPKRRGAPSAGPKYSDLKAARALGLTHAAAELAEAGIVGVEARHGERVGRIRLGVGEDEVRLALGEDESVKGMGFGA
jgi:origin recognition complex subunit 1